MKKLFTKQIFYASATVIAATSVFVACQEDLPLTPWTPGEIVTTGTAKVMFIHASPNIYLPNSVSLSFNGGSVATLNYGDKTGYFDASVGTTYQSFNARTSAVYDSTQIVKIVTTYPGAPLDSTPQIDTTFKEWWCPNKDGNVFDMNQANAVLRSGEKYAAYITGDRYHSRYLLASAGTVPEEHTSTTLDTCTVRYINLVSDADTSALIVNVNAFYGYKMDFLNFTPPLTTVSGSITYEFWELGSPTPLLTKTFNLQARKIYNVVFKGLKNGTGSQALDAELIEL